MPTITDGSCGLQTEKSKQSQSFLKWEWQLDKVSWLLFCHSSHLSHCSKSLPAIITRIGTHLFKFLPIQHTATPCPNIRAPCAWDVIFIVICPLDHISAALAAIQDEMWWGRLGYVRFPWSMSWDWKGSLTCFGSWNPYTDPGTSGGVDWWNIAPRLVFVTLLCSRLMLPTLCLVVQAAAPGYWWPGPAQYGCWNMLWLHDIHIQFSKYRRGMISSNAFPNWDTSQFQS